ncbi:MAG: hypothetical protein JWQ97_2590 [Phenylobacterium sp.]|nr:hypothetical protein [Phenylobacterium sp.]
MRFGTVLLALSLAMFAGPAGSAPKKTSYKHVVERAWATALRPQNATGRCWAKIGRDPALALTRYCVQNAPTLHNHCWSGNSCELLAGAIWGWCRDSKWDPAVTGATPPDPKHLPCSSSFDMFGWDNVEGTLAY